VLRNEVLRNAKQNCPLPVNLRRLIWNAQKLFGCKPHRLGPTGKPCPPSPSAILLQAHCLLNLEPVLRFQALCPGGLSACFAGGSFGGRLLPWLRDSLRKIA